MTITRPRLFVLMQIKRRPSSRPRSGHPEMPPYGGDAADFALTANALGIIAGVEIIAIVETELCAALHVGICLFMHAAFDLLASRYLTGGTA